MENSQSKADQKLDDYELTNELEAKTPEEQTEPLPKEPLDLGVGASSVGDGVYASVREQEAHDTMLAKEYEAANRDSHFDLEAATDDAYLFRHADTPQALPPPTTDQEREEEKALRISQDAVALTSEVEEQVLSRDPDREIHNPAVGQNNKI